jgi:hypothetical protein
MSHEKIKTFEGACKSLKLNPKKVLPDFSSYPKQHHAGMIAHAKLVIIVQALNEGWKPDWDNRSEYKYYPWFNMESSSGFPVCVCVNGDSRSSLGSRLCYKSEEIAKYAGKQFIKLYKEYFTL